MYISCTKCPSQFELQVICTCAEPVTNRPTTLPGKHAQILGQVENCLFLHGCTTSLHLMVQLRVL